MISNRLDITNDKPTKYARSIWAIVGLILILWGLRVANYVTTLSWVTLFAIVSIALGLLVIFIASMAKTPYSPELRWVGLIALFLVVIMFGVWAYLQIYQVPGYGTDEIAFDQYAGFLAAHFHNPYLTSMLPSFKRYGVSPNSYTFLLDGSVVSRLSYPSLSFLFYVPLEWIGIDQQSAIILNLVGWATGMIFMYRLLPREIKGIAIIVGSFSVYVGYAVGGVTDALFVPFLIVAAFQWDRFGLSDMPWLRRYISPIALGIAMAVKQNAWLILPLICIALYIEDRHNISNQGNNLRRSVRYALITVVAFLLPNLPFILDSPLQWFSGIFQPILAHAIPAGQGIVGFSLFVGLGGGSLTAYSVLEFMALVFVIGAYVIGYRFIKQLVFFMPSFVFFFASRSFGSYFVTMLPALIISLVSTSRIDAGLDKSKVVSIYSAMLIALLAGFGVSILFKSPLQLNIVSIHTTGEVQTIDQVTVSVTNNSGHPVTPHFSVQESGTVTAFWNPVGGSPTISANSSENVVLQAPNFYGMPPIVGGFQVVAYTTSPATVSVSSIFIAQQYHIKIYPDAVDKLVPLNHVIPVQAQLVNQFNQPVNLSKVKIYFSQIIYGQNGLLPGNAVIYSKDDNSLTKYQGTSPVYALTNSTGQATFYIEGRTLFRDPLYFEANLVSSTKYYPFGYSEILSIRFTSG